MAMDGGDGDSDDDDDGDDDADEDNDESDEDYEIVLRFSKPKLIFISSKSILI